MEKLLIIPENKRQLDLLKSLLKEMKIKFVPTFTEDEADNSYTTEELHQYIEKARQEKKDGKLVTIETKKLWQSI